MRAKSSFAPALGFDARLEALITGPVLFVEPPDAGTRSAPSPSPRPKKGANDALAVREGEPPVAGTFLCDDGIGVFRHEPAQHRVGASAEFGARHHRAPPSTAIGPCRGQCGGPTRSTQVRATRTVYSHQHCAFKSRVVCFLRLDQSSAA